MNPETKFIHQLKNALPAEWHWTRIETTTEQGVPDICVGNKLGDIWIEAKAGSCRVRKEQLAWALRARAAGRLVLLMSPMNADTLSIVNLSDARLDYTKDFAPAGKSYFRVSNLERIDNITHTQLIDKLSHIQITHNYV